MQSILILNGLVVNENKIEQLDLFIKDGKINKIAKDLSQTIADITIDATGKHIIPGLIDDQVHFREPGLTHKATIYTEAKAAVAGGTTSFMEMPNTNPQTLTQELLEKKYQIGAKDALANYSFYMGVSNDNYEEAMKTNPENVCGLKIFMGSSTGNMLVDNIDTLDKIFKDANLLIATHCEDEATIKRNIELYKEKYGNDVLPSMHPEIRSEEACYISSSQAVALAKKNNTRLHILHISTGKEVALFDNTKPLRDKLITSEACVHHLWFDKSDYDKLGFLIKWNPAVKESPNKDLILKGVLDNHIDVIATDHAPHTWEEKQNNYWTAPSGGPLIQHTLQVLLDMFHEGKISLEKIVEKTSHAVAECFRMIDRGYIREGYWADIVIVDINKKNLVKKEQLHYLCKWSAFEGHEFKSTIESTIVSGHLAYHNLKFDESKKGERLKFEKNRK